MAALGFGLDAFAATEAAGFFVPCDAACCADAALPFAVDVDFLPRSFFAAVLLVLAAAFFAVAGFFVTCIVFAEATAFFVTGAGGSSFFSVNSNAGLGSGRSCGPMRVMSAAGFTPAAAAAFADAAVSAACFGLPSMSGFTMTWLS